MVSRGRTWRRRHKAKPQHNRAHVLLDAEYIELLKWAKQNGVDFGSVRPAMFDETGRGMIATRKISNGDCIISVPKRLLITTTTALNSRIGKLLTRMSQWPNTKLSRKCTLCLFVVYLKWLGHKSFWFPYIATLPKDFNTPCYFNEDELKMLPESSLQQCLAQINEVRRAFDKIKQTFNDNIQDCDHDFLNFFTYDDFKWAWFVVNTRSVYLASGDEKCSCCYGACCHGDGYALAPVLDLLNHQDTAEVSAGFHQNSQAYKIHTMSKYQRQKQVFINYGPHDNATLLIEYGFVLPKNINNVFKFKPEQVFQLLKLSASLNLIKKMNLIKRNGLEKDFSCTEDYGISWSMWAALRILALEEIQLGQWTKVLDGEPVSDTNEAIVNKWMVLILSHTLMMLHKKDCEQSVHSTNMQLALKLRNQEKKMLRTALGQINAAQNSN